MELTFFSLLYPSEQSQKDHFSGKYCPDIDTYTLSELGMLFRRTRHPRFLGAGKEKCHP